MYKTRATPQRKVLADAQRVHLADVRLERMAYWAPGKDGPTVSTLADLRRSRLSQVQDAFCLVSGSFLLLLYFLGL